MRIYMYPYIHTQTYTLIAVIVLFSFKTFLLVYSYIFNRKILRWTQFTVETFIRSLRIWYLVLLPASRITTRRLCGTRLCLPEDSIFASVPIFLKWKNCGDKGVSFKQFTEYVTTQGTVNEAVWLRHGPLGQCAVAVEIQQIWMCCRTTCCCLSVRCALGIHYKHWSRFHCGKL